MASENFLFTIGNKHTWYHFSTAITLCNQYLLDNNVKANYYKCSFVAIHSIVVPIFHSKQMYYPAMENHKCRSLSEMLKFFTICERFDLLVALAGEKAGDPQSHYDSSSRYLYRILSMVKMFESEPKKWFDRQISPTVEKTLLAWLKNVGTEY